MIERERERERRERGEGGWRGGEESGAAAKTSQNKNLVAISDTLQHFNGAPHHHTKEEKSTPTQLFKQKPKTKPTPPPPPPKTKPFGFFF